MKRLLNYKIGVKALAVLLVAGIIVTGVNLDAYAGVYNIGGQDYQIDDKYILDYDNNGVIDETDYMFAYQRQEADKAAAAQAAAEAEAARVAAEQVAAAEAARIAAEQEAQRIAAEQAAAQKAAEEEAARLAEAQKRAAEEAARQAAEDEAARIAAEQAAAQKAAEEEAARLAEAQKRAAEEAARQAAEDEAARIAAEQEAQRKAAEEAAKKAAEEAAKPVKRDTPNAQKDILTNHRLTNVPENSAISGNNGVNWANCSGGTYDFSNQQYDSIKAAVAAQGSLNILVKALGDNTTTLDSDVQTITINTSDFPQKTKRSAANASFDAATSVLSGLDDSKYSIDGGKSWSGVLSGQITVANVHPELEILVINVARNENEEDSPSAQTIWISKADKPTNVVANPVTKIGGYGSLVNVAPGQEYCKTGTGAWTDITGTVVEHLEVGSYDVRVKAKGTMLASDIYTVSVAGYNAKKEATPNASFDGARYNLYNINCGCAYSVDDVNWITITDASCTNVTLSREVAEKAVHGNGIRIKRLGDNINTIDSDWQTISIAEAVRPSSVGTTPATNGSNGSITGVASDMQYRKDGGNWNDIGSGTVSGLGAGKYYVRRKGSGTTIPSEEVGVTIDNKQSSPGKQNTPNASFNAWIMTLSNMNGCKYSLDGGNNYSGKSDKNDIVLSEGDIKIDKGIKVIRCGDSGTLDSDVQTISLSKMPAPTGISATSATAKTGGMITGVSSYMEYRAANAGSWTVPNGNTIANLPAGTYYVRNRGQYSSMPSDVLVIVIQLGTTPTVVQPTQSTIVVSPVATKTETKTDTKTDTKTETKTETKTDTKTEDTKTEEKKSEETAKTEETAASTEEDGFVVDPAATETPAATEEQSVFAKGEPILLADQGVQGWGAIEGSMSKESTEPVAVDLTNADTVIPATTIAAAASTETELILDVAPDMAWSIMPSEISSANTDVDLGITENTNDIPKEMIAKVESEDGKVAKEFTIKHEGDFGFKAHLTVALDKEDAGKTAKLYYYNKLTGLMEVVDTAVINSYGEATFALTHASSYAVTVNTMTASADGDKANVTEKTTAKKSSSKWWIWVIVIAVVLTAAACGVVIYLKKKEEEARRRRHHANHNGANHNGTGHNDTTHK